MVPLNNNVTEGSASMPTEKQMTVNERRKYLKLMKPRYQKAERSRLLMEMEKVTGLHCKSPPRLLHASSLNRKKRTTRKGPERANQVRKEVPMCSTECRISKSPSRMEPMKFGVDIFVACSSDNDDFVLISFRMR
jgi:hypothetical protein